MMSLHSLPVRAYFSLFLRNNCMGIDSRSLWGPELQRVGKTPPNLSNIHDFGAGSRFKCFLGPRVMVTYLFPAWKREKTEHTLYLLFHSISPWPAALETDLFLLHVHSPLRSLFSYTTIKRHVESWHHDDWHENRIKKFRNMFEINYSHLIQYGILEKLVTYRQSPIFFIFY